MRRLWWAALALLIAAPLQAQNDRRTLALDYDLDSTSYVYPVCPEGTQVGCTQGATDEDGWVRVAAYFQITVSVEYNQGDLDALHVKWECRTEETGATPQRVYPNESSDCGIGGTLETDVCAYATAPAENTIANPGAWDQCRVGIKVKTTDTSDAGGALEKISAFIIGKRTR